MLYYDINDVNVEHKVEVCTKRECTNCNFLNILLNRNISVINGAKLIKFGIVVVGVHLDGTVSQIFHLWPSFYFMKIWLEEMAKSFSFFDIT